MEECGLFESEDDKGLGLWSAPRNCWTPKHELQMGKGDAEHCAGHHAERKPSIVTAAASGLVNYLLMFGELLDSVHRDRAVEGLGRTTS
eukprot:2626080-Amphidinium_carterae.1